MDTNTHCPFCSSLIYPTDNFCPNCGKALHTSVTISFTKKLYIYAVSLLLPPLGLIWTFKYYRSDDSKLRRLGLIAGVLTVVSLIVTIWWTVGFFQSIQQQISTYSSLGY